MDERIPLYEDETLEDLQRDGLRLIQKEDGFRFGEDSVFLTHYARQAASRIRGGARIVDLGCGCGLVSVMLSALLPASRITGIEMAREAARVAERNVRLNRISDRVRIVEGDLRDPHTLIERDFDMVVSNPPYRKIGDGPSGSAARRAAAREDTLSLEDLVASARRLLRPKGVFVLIHQARRLPDLFCLLRDRGIEPHGMREILPSADKPAKSVLVSAVKGGRPGGFSPESPLTVRNPDRSYTDEVTGWYRGGSLDAEQMMDGLVRQSGCDMEHEVE